MNHIETYTGKLIDPLNPHQDDIEIVDISHALSMNCRFNGHCSEFYSVAEHSVYVSKLVPPEIALKGLLHDAAEAYISDVCYPIKLRWPWFKEAEDALLEVIFDKFGLSNDFPEELEFIDRGISILEADRLGIDVNNMVKPPGWDEREIDIKINVWSPIVAESMFLEHWQRLTNG